MAQSINQILSDRATLIEDALERTIVTPAGGLPALDRLRDAMAYSTLGGGKRLRPFLVTECARLFDAKLDDALPAACAIEMIHCYSLVHDDLPAMDDSDLRRGRPSVHKQFDEAIAILAGDGLLTDAFSVLTTSRYDPEVATALVRVLALASGSQGMVGGQMMDLYPVSLSEDEIIGIQQRKTGALIVAAAEMGAIVGRASDADRGHLKDYASAIGLAFQIVDDILDVTQSSEQLGKPAGADEDADKATFVSLLGLEGARQRVASLTDQAREKTAPFGANAANLIALADQLATRTK